MRILLMDGPETAVGPVVVARQERQSGLVRGLEHAGHEVLVTRLTADELASGERNLEAIGQVDVVHAWSVAVLPLVPRGVPLVLSPRVSVSRLGGQSVVHVERGASAQVAGSPEPIRTMVLPSVEAGTAWPSELSSVPIVTVPTGVDTGAFQPEGPRSPVRENRLRVLVLGSPGTAHGFLDVVRALKHLPTVQPYPTVDLVFTAGPEVDLSVSQDARETYALACALGLGEQVSFARPFGPDLTAQVLRSADVVATIGGDDVPHHLTLQAMAVGRPILATNMGAYLDIVVDQVTGLLVPHGNELALTTALRRIVDDSFFRESLGLSSRDRAVSRFDWGRVSAELIRVYERSIEAAHPMEGTAPIDLTTRTQPDVAR